MHPSREVVALLVSRLHGLRAAGDLTTEHVRQAAAGAGVTERTVWRWLREGVPGASGRHAYRLTDVDRDAFAAAHGSVPAAWRAQRAAGALVPPLRTYQRAFARELLPIERAAAADGVEGQRRHTVYLRWEAEHRNQRWEADHVELPVLVLPPRARRPRAPWATLFLDAYSRLVMGWALSVAPSAATVLAALHVGMVVDPERGPFGGVPAMLRPDRGLEFAAQAIGQAAGALGVLVLPTPAHTPHLKGKIERLGRTIAQDFLCTLQLAPAELFTATAPDPVAASADDRAIEAALLAHGDTITTDSLADTLGWPLGRLEHALRALDRRLQATGARLCRTGWHRYRIQPNRRALPAGTWQRLDHAHQEQRELTAATATRLCLLVRGIPLASDAWEGDGGLRQLRQQQLIEGEQPPFRLSADVRYSLLLDEYE